MATKERLVMESLFHIVDKELNCVPFLLNDAQIELDNRLTGRDATPKARQRGISSYFLMRYLAICLGVDNARCVVISHETEATQRMLAKVHYAIDTINGPKPVIKTLSKNEISFPKRNSVFYIGTAGSRAFGRGDTISHLHCSEIAYWPDPKSLAKGLFQAVPRGGEIAVESTGNGTGNYYHRLVMRSEAVGNELVGQRPFRVHFFPWHTEKEYCVDLTDEEAEQVMNHLNPLTEEPEIVKQFGLTAGQIVWRREKLNQEFDGDLLDFKQEYPMTLDECFQASGRGIFRKISYLPSGDWQSQSPQMHILSGHPMNGHSYVAGCDVSAGVGGDRSVIEVADVGDMEQVAEWVSDKTAPDVFAHRAVSLARHFNNAYLAVESNNHGLTTINEIVHGGPGRTPLYPLDRLHKDAGKRVKSIVRYGINTNVGNRAMMIGWLKQLLATGFIIHSIILKGELSTFSENEDGKLEAEQGCFDDCVMAMVMMSHVMERAGWKFAEGHELLPVDIVESPFLLETIIEELRRRRGTYPIAPQDGNTL